MRLRRFDSLAGVALYAAVACGALTAGPGASASSSTAYGVAAHFVAKGISTGLGPLDPVAGNAPPGYIKTIDLSNVRQVVHLTEGSVVPTLAVSAGQLASHVASAGIAVDSVSAEGEAQVSNLDISLMLYPAPPGPVPQPFLHLTATKVASTANFSQVFPGPGHTGSSARFSGLIIEGSLVGSQPIRRTGTVPYNTVLFHSDTVTITLNNHLVGGLISCTPKCVFSQTFIAATAIDITLKNADLDGHVVSGDITIAQSQAGVGQVHSLTIDYGKNRP
jgi:hypothetical protein